MDTEEITPEITPETFIGKLKSALRKDGDFPASAKTVTELRMLVNDPKTTASQITEVILREPSLGIRVLHLVNSSFYRRGKTIMTVTQAVVQIGMKPLAELCAGLILLQKFVPAARQGGPFAYCLRRSVLSSLLASSVSNQISVSETSREKANDETGYLAGAFAELGTLLLAFYFPQIYESALKRAEEKGLDLGTAIKHTIGLTPLQLSTEVIRALELPAYYIDVLEASQEPKTVANLSKLPTSREQVMSTANSVFAGTLLSDVISAGKGKLDMDKALSKLKDQLGVSPETLLNVVGSITPVYLEHCSSLQLTLPSLPEYLRSYEKAAAEKSAGSAAGSDAAEESVESNVRDYIEEIKRLVDERAPTATIVTTVMETLAFGLGFDRVIMMLVNQSRDKLIGRMMLGQIPNFDATKFHRPIGRTAHPQAVDNLAFSEGRAVFAGEPVFEDGWPRMAIPIGFGKRAVGVVYGDRSKTVDAAIKRELTSREQANITLLAELLDNSIAAQGKN